MAPPKRGDARNLCNIVPARNNSPVCFWQRSRTIATGGGASVTNTAAQAGGTTNGALLCLQLTTSMGMLMSRDHLRICQLPDCATDSPESLGSAESAGPPQIQRTSQIGAGYIRTALQHVSSLSLCSTCQYNLSYWLQLLSAVTLIAPFSAKTNLRLVVPFGIPQVVTRCKDLTSEAAIVCQPNSMVEQKC